MAKSSQKNPALFSIAQFIRGESMGGFLLIIVTIIAVIWANSGYYDSYKYLWYELKMGISFGDFELNKPLHYWINDGLMALFFFMVGLEIKREVLGGELSSLKKAGLPVVAAIGGMIVPAAIYIIFNYNNPQHVNGWGIPMATDIAFALGMMSLLGKKVPVNLKIFLTALAIADDLGAILVIAIFYTDTINVQELINAGIFLAILAGGNRLGIRKTGFYAIIGFAGVWLSFFYSGVHATIAGVLIALTIPVKPKVTEAGYIARLSTKLDRFKAEQPNDVNLLTKGQAHVISAIQHLSDQAHTPLQKLEYALHPLTTYFILPVFALSNAGVHIEGSFFQLLFHPISLGIIFGLVLGKLLGISLLSRLVVKMKWLNLPEGVGWMHIYGAGLLAGIGFTMSIFISGLAFADENFVQIAKVGIFAASFISAIAGMWVLSLAGKKS